MGHKPVYHPDWHTLWRRLPSAAELRDYRQLCKEVLLVIASFLSVGLLLALVASLLSS